MALVLIEGVIASSFSVVYASTREIAASKPSATKIHALDCPSFPIPIAGTNSYLVAQNTNDYSLIDAFQFTDTGSAIFVDVTETTDGGQTWQIVADPQIPAVYRDIALALDANNNVAAFICNGDWIMSYT